MTKLPFKYVKFLQDHPLPLMALSFFDNHALTHEDAVQILSKYREDHLNNTAHQNIQTELIIIHQALQYIKNDEMETLNLFYELIIVLGQTAGWNEILFNTTYIDAILYDLDLEPFTSYPSMPYANTFLSSLVDADTWPTELNFVFEDHILDILKYTASYFVVPVLTSTNEIIASRHSDILNQTSMLCNTINDFITFDIQEVLPLYINDVHTSENTKSVLYMYTYCMKQKYDNILNMRSAKDILSSVEHDSTNIILQKMQANLKYVDAILESNSFVSEHEKLQAQDMYVLYGSPLEESKVIEFLHFYSDYVNTRTLSTPIIPSDVPFY